MHKYIVFTNTGAPTATESWTWEFLGTTDNPTSHRRHAMEAAPDVSLMYVPVAQAAAAPIMLDALHQVNAYMISYEQKEYPIDYIMRSRHNVREAIARAND